ncbi:macrolide 2'-phosphotransferase MphH [Yaniella flava]|uniref:Macrolide 2'-phosphotransferase MphH n=1 Tax=Yaniella flava TaxID=287930 RepID=A0ABN2UVB1_9MICC
MTNTSQQLIDEIVRLAAAHDLTIDQSTVAVNELGLDFRVAIARTDTGDQWVLRIPRHADVTTRAEVEGRLLRLVAGHLDVAVPDWHIQTSELIAYPLLPGTPGLELDARSEPQWHADVSSTAFASTLGNMLAQLHSIDVEQARSTGVQVRSPAEVREGWREDIATVAAEFKIAPGLLDRWNAWLSDDSYWPTHSVPTHGEVYPGHTLVIDNRVTAVIDWTTAEVGDPARDFVFHHATASTTAFNLTVQRYIDGGGSVWPKFGEHCAHRYSASPVSYGLYALTTGDEEHRTAAAAQLNPSEAS